MDEPTLSERIAAEFLRDPFCRVDKADALVKEVEALEKRLEEWGAAARYLLAHYPEDVFPATSDSPDAKAGTFARRILTWLLDPAERTRLADLDDAAARTEEKSDE
jgi:hypothetical protein